MHIEEIAQRLHVDPNIPAGKTFITSLAGHLVLLEVIKNRTDMIKSSAEVEIPEPVIEGLADVVPSEEPQQIEKEPLDAGQSENTGGGV